MIALEYWIFLERLERWGVPLGRSSRTRRWVRGIAPSWKLKAPGCVASVWEGKGRKMRLRGGAGRNQAEGTLMWKATDCSHLWAP